jgi:hypothetical protein
MASVRSDRSHRSGPGRRLRSGAVSPPLCFVARTGIADLWGRGGVLPSLIRNPLDARFEFPLNTHRERQDVVILRATPRLDSLQEAAHTRAPLPRRHPTHAGALVASAWNV